MQGIFQKIASFFMAIVAFFSGLFGLNKPAEPEQPADPTPFDVEIIEEARTILSNPDSPFNYFAWPTVARLPDGRLAVVCSGFRREHICPFGQAVMMTSGDEGKTYSPAVPVIETPLDDRDAGIVSFGENGVIVTSFNNSREAQRGWNPDNEEYMAYVDTVTDEDEARYLGATYRISSDGGETFGDILISPVSSPHGPTALRDGSLVWVGRTFSANNVFEDTNAIQAYKIAEDGAMTYLGAVPQVFKDGKKVNMCEPSAIELPDGTLLCHFRGNNLVFTVYQTRSTDGGRTWSQPEQLLDDFGGAPPHLYLHSSGVLICAYGYRAGPTFGIRVMLSRDYGVTWDKDIVLWEEGVSADLGYPATVERKDGSLLTVFYAKDAADGPAVIKQIHWKIV